MKLLRLHILAALLAIALAAVVELRAESAGPAFTASRDLTDAEVRQAMHRVFNAQIREAMVWTDSLAPICKGEPMYHLVRARLQRELIPVDDEQKEVVKELAQPLYTELDRVIATCDARIKAGDTDPELRLYRGWAWMFSSHVHTYEKSFWSAGRDAKKGKEDLEWYLRQQPSEPIASSLMGAFLYFADTLPSAYQFVSKLLFLPSGDRDRGLQMMELAQGYDSIQETDNALILYSVYIGFEGRFEEGLEGFSYLRRSFPRHATFVRPETIMYPLLPRRGSAVGDSLDAAIARLGHIPPNETDHTTFTLIRFQRAYADRIDNPTRAVLRVEQMIEENPAHPDWVPSFSAFELGRIMAQHGDDAHAMELWKHVLADTRTKYLHDEAKKMLSDLDDPPAPTGPGPSDVEAIYGSDVASRERVRASLEAVQNPTVADQFYLGEAWLMSGDQNRALDAYTGVVNPKACAWDHCYQMIASARAGEILASRGEYKAAAKHYQRAGSFWHKELYFDWLFEARKRYFERLEEGKETTPPNMLTNNR
jgi:tetratricopeptide (TPR) repeat protein